MVQGKSFGSFHLVAPGGNEQLRHLLRIHVFLDRAVVRGSSELNTSKASSLSTSLRACLDGFRGL